MVTKELISELLERESNEVAKKHHTIRLLDSVIMSHMTFSELHFTVKKCVMLCNAAIQLRILRRNADSDVV